MKETYIKICPKCSSTNIERKITPMSAVGIRNPLHCNSCNFEGELFPEVEEDKINEFKKSLKQNKK